MSDLLGDSGSGRGSLSSTADYVSRHVRPQKKMFISNLKKTSSRGKGAPKRGHAPFEVAKYGGQRRGIDTTDTVTERKRGSAKWGLEAARSGTSVAGCARFETNSPFWVAT